MSGVRIVSDTNPLIYLLNGNEQIANHLDGKECWISVISELELYGKKLLSATDKREIDSLLNSCFIIDLLPEVKKLVKGLQQSSTLKLPDAIIAATALYLNLPLLTADKTFRRVKELELVLITF
jgi:predicted nucleic acid-binding protein